MVEITKRTVLEVVFRRGLGVEGVEYFTSEAEFEAWLRTGFRAADINFDVERVSAVLVGRAVSFGGAIVAARRQARLVGRYEIAGIVCVGSGSAR